MMDRHPSQLRHEQWFRLIAAAIALAATLFSVMQSCRWTAPGKVYVGGGVRWLRDGRTPEAAFRTIQDALDQALPGDTIVVADGWYREQLQIRRGGTAQQPVLIQALNPGRAIVSRETPLSEALSKAWKDEGAGFYSATTRWPIYRVHLSEATLFRIVYGGPDRLRALVEKPNAFSSFCWEDGRLLVWLKKSERTQLKDLITHCRAPEPREWGEFRSANVAVQAEHVIMQGFDLRMGVGAGVLLMKSSGIVLEDCAMSGANYGVMSPGQCDLSGPLTVRRCLYHHFPQYEWRKSWLSWDDIYVGHASSSLISSNVSKVIVEDSVAVHTGDAIRMSNETSSVDPAAFISGNLLALGTDDALELEGPARNIRVVNNLVYEFHESLGLSPVEVGPVEILENVFLHERDGTNGAQVKLINREGTECGIRNIRIDNNVFVGNWLCWTAGAVQDVRVRNNVFCVQRQSEPKWPTGVTEVENRYLDWTATIRRELDGHEMTSAGISDQLLAVSVSDSATPAMSVLEKFNGKTKPGPLWWNWQHPATAAVAERITTISNEVLPP